MHLWMVVCRVLFLGHCDLTSDLVFRIFMSGAYLILFSLGIPNLVFGCNLGWHSVMYQVLGHCDLDLFSRNIVAGAYLLYYLR